MHSVFLSDFVEAENKDCQFCSTIYRGVTHVKPVIAADVSSMHLLIEDELLTVEGSHAIEG